MKIPAHFHPTAIAARATRRAMDIFTKTIHLNQPQADASHTHLGYAHVGDVCVELYGSVERNVHGKFLDLYVEDVTVAGTLISLETIIGRKEWDRLEEDARDRFNSDEHAACAEARGEALAEWARIGGSVQ